MARFSHEECKFDNAHQIDGPFRHEECKFDNAHQIHVDCPFRHEDVNLIMLTQIDGPFFT